ncbi:MAG TPA: SPOR domain-containing protein [Thermodesulfobacteriota bacterium]|nr:SPOR domain-containing protein [Thermodesulfobacteriota bacterium]
MSFSRLLSIIYFILAVLAPISAISQEVKVEILHGLYITTFKTPEGGITIFLPDGLASGDKISGTVALEPTGHDEYDKNRNRKKLSEYFIELEKDRIPITEKIKWTIPISLTGSATYIIVMNKENHELARAIVPVRANTSLLEQASNPSPWDYLCPMIGRGGKPIQIMGPFDGDFDTTLLKMGGKPVKIIAESPRKLVFESPGDVVGITDIELKEGTVIVKRSFNNLRVVKINEEKTLATRKQPVISDTREKSKKDEEEWAKEMTFTQKLKETPEVSVLPDKQTALVPTHPNESREVAKTEEDKKIETPMPAKAYQVPDQVEQLPKIEPTDRQKKEIQPITPQQQKQSGAQVQVNKEETQAKETVAFSKKPEEDTAKPISGEKKEQVFSAPQSKKGLKREGVTSLGFRNETPAPHMKAYIEKETKEQKPSSITPAGQKAQTGEKETARTETLPELTPSPSVAKKDLEPRINTEKEETKTDEKITREDESLSNNQTASLFPVQTPTPFIRAEEEVDAEANTEDPAPKEIASFIPVEANTLYTVQVAAFKRESDAVDFAKALKSKGYPAFVKKAGGLGKDTWHRVRVGMFRTEEDARLLGLDLRRQVKEIQSWFITLND